MLNNYDKLIYYRHNKTGKVIAIPSSRIVFYELTIVLEGKIDYLINGTLYNLVAGDVIYLPKDTIRQRLESTVNADYVSFNFYTDSAITLPVHIQSGVTNRIRIALKVCDEIYEHYFEGGEKMILPLLFNILFMLEADLNAKTQNPTIKIIQKYIKQNIKEKILIKHIAKAAAYSPAYCDTLFKKETGKSLNDYIIQLRIEEAKRLLLEKGLSLKNIAQSVGFSDYNYFARTFKKRTGYTPSEYSISNINFN